MKRFFALLLLLPAMLCCAGAERNFHIQPEGVTISATVRLKSRPRISGSGFDEKKRIIYQHDIIASKGGEFVFGRRSDKWCDQLYLNFKDGGKWAVPLTLTAKSPNRGQWAVWSAVIRPVIEPEQGVRKTLITLYINGEAKYSTVVDKIPDKENVPLLWGKGCGINGDSWNLHGDIAEKKIIRKALSDDDVLRLAATSKLVKIDLAGAVAPAPALAKKLDGAAKKAAIPLTKWIIHSLRRAVANGFEQRAVDGALSENLCAVSAVDEQKCLNLWRSGSGVKLLVSGRLALLIAEGKSSGAFPVLGCFDLKSQRGIFGKYPVSWQLDGKLKKRNHSIKMSGFWQNLSRSANSWEARWDAPGMVTVVLKIQLLPNRLEMQADFVNKNPDFQVNMFAFPVVQLAEMKRGKSYLVHPFMSGILHYDPVNNPNLGRPDFWYPSGAMSMQFGAYCDDASGVYLSPEDPDAAMKQYIVTNRNRGVELRWSQPVPHVTKGANNPEKSSGAVIELIDGNWFDAAMTYKRFAMQKGSWTRGRFRPTPKWYLENMLWILHFTHGGEKSIEAVPGMMKKIKDYFALPVAIHWYHWYDYSKGGWPHYIAYKNVKKVNAQMRADGVRSKAYIDTKLWSELDGPDFKSDWQFSSHGKPAALINEHGKFLYEKYRKACREVVMCPAYGPWQKRILDVSERTAGEGFDAIYHDQVGASYPRQCFSAKHGHKPNHPELWQKGYVEMFRKICQLNRKFPELAHDTEDASDAHLQLFDGFLSWRWTDDNQIPLFSAVYGGLTQFTGRTYAHHEKLSFFVKAATQLLYGEQFGWFMAERLWQQRKRASYIKQLMHLRHHLLGYFNGGMMCRPLEFTVPPKPQTTPWGDSRGRYTNVTMPEILHAVWQKRSNGKRVIILVNTSPNSAHAQALLPEGRFYSCKRSGKVVPVAGKVYRIALEPGEIELLMDDKADAAVSGAALKKFASFTEKEFFRSFGILAPEGVVPVAEKFDNQPGSVLTIQGDKVKNLWKKVPLALEPERDYILKVKLRIDPGSKGSFAVYNYSSRSKLKGYTSGSVPADGKWHTVVRKFRSDADVFNTSVFFYNNKSGGKIYADDLEIAECQ